MNPLVYPNVGALLLAAQVQTYLAAGKVRLYQAGKGIMLGPTTTLADLTAAGVEADYTGYAAGGIAVAAWLDPLLADLGGAAIDSGLVSFVPAAPYTVGNTIQGWWYESAGGDLLFAGDFPTNKGIAGAGDGIRYNIELILFG